MGIRKVSVTQETMSGHSKWSKIKRQKGLEDQKRGAEFSRLSKAIAIAARQGGGDPQSNPSLRMAIDKAKQLNMPKDNIKRAIERGCGKDGGVSLEQITYEGYGPMGVAVMVTVATDNRQRTGAEIRSIFERMGGSLGSPGSASYMFSKIGGKLLPQSKIDVFGAEAERVRNFLKALREHDDVEELVHTANLG